jgi:hypothetical protein
MRGEMPPCTSSTLDYEKETRNHSFKLKLQTILQLSGEKNLYILPANSTRKNNVSLYVTV